jgi:hypothetical protein
MCQKDNPSSVLTTWWRNTEPNPWLSIQLEATFSYETRKGRTIMEDTDTWSTAFDALDGPASLIAPTRHTASHRVLNFNCEHAHAHTNTHTHTHSPSTCSQNPMNAFAKPLDCRRQGNFIFQLTCPTVQNWITLLSIGSSSYLTIVSVNILG